MFRVWKLNKKNNIVKRDNLGHQHQHDTNERESHDVQVVVKIEIEVRVAIGAEVKAVRETIAVAVTIVEIEVTHEKRANDLHEAVTEPKDTNIKRNRNK